MNTLNQVLIIQIQHLKILNQRLKALIQPPDVNQLVKVLIQPVKTLNQEPKSLIQVRPEDFGIMLINQWGYRMV